MNKITMDALKPFFVREINSDPIYTTRLTTEIDLLEKLDFIKFIVRFTEIYNQHIKPHHHLLRGSAASSLLLYYLGINSIDPIQYNIPLSRFINVLRLSKPDIDIDLPMNLRDEIISGIVANNPDTIRISCNLKNEDNIYFDSLVREEPSLNLLHNSGLVVFSDDQKQTIVDNLITPTQIKLTKDCLDAYNLKKVDLLSNTAVEQLNKIQTKIGKNIDFANFDDQDVYQFMIDDDGTGITYAETPLIQYVIAVLGPRSIEQFSQCLAIVRPFACRNIRNSMTFDSLKDKIIYDDDFIMFLVNKLNFTEEKADEIRRVFKKNTDLVEMKSFYELLDRSELNGSITTQDKWKIRKTLPRLKSYSFCKAHSISYARLIYMLYFCKYHYPKIFWEGTIMSIKGYYNDWVYIRKGLDAGLKFKGIKKCNQFLHFVNTGYWLGKEFLDKCYLKIIEPPQQKDNIVNLNETADNDSDDDGEEEENNDNNCDNDSQHQSSMHLHTESNPLELNVTDYDLDNYYLAVDQKKLPTQKEQTNPRMRNAEKKIFRSKECQFRGLVAASSCAFSRNGSQQSILTIGVNNNKFIDLHLNKKRDFKQFKQVIGKGYYIDGIKPHVIITHMQIF
jgi:hypothetical protein